MFMPVRPPARYACSIVMLFWDPRPLARTFHCLARPVRLTAPANAVLPDTRAARLRVRETDRERERYRQRTFEIPICRPASRR